MTTLYRFEIAKAKLEALSPDELKILLGFGKIFNDLNIASKCLKFATNGVRAEVSDAERSAAMAQAMYFCRILAGHVYEAREFFNDCVRIDQLKKAGGKHFNNKFFADVKEINKYFGRRNIVHELRRKLAFHTTSEALLKAFQDIQEGYSYEVFLGQEYAGHQLFYGSEILMADGVQHLRPHDTWEDAIKATYGETTAIAYKMSLILQRVIGFILIRLGVSLDDAETVPAGDAPPIDTVTIPYFCVPPIDYGPIAPD